MPRRASLRNRRPRDFVVFGSGWPDGELVADAPEAVQVAQLIARRVGELMGDEPGTRAAEESGLHHRQLYDLLAGERLPSLATVVHLERGMGVDLWPRRDQR